ncbi:MAG: hypothetical protein M0042_05340 [Nitrospiraceae bacterium]|nr:hypothetical protein [Nitrospiraceae bacterium]
MSGTIVTALYVVLSVVLMLPARSLAASLEGESNTYVMSRETADKTKLLPVYEYLNFSIQNLGDESLSANVGGWFRYDTKAVDNESNRDNDLQYAYLSYKKSGTTVNVGRVMVFEGVAAERVDGAYGRTDLGRGFGVSAFGGSAVATGQTGTANTIYGGRLTHQIAGLYTIGFSYLKEDTYPNNQPGASSATFREEEGIDLWVRPVAKVELMGRSNYNAGTKGWMEHTYYLVLGPFANLRLNTEASWINYEDYFSSSTLSVFQFQAGGPIDPKEKASILGEEAVYGIGDKWTVSADYKRYGYDIAGNANYYGAKVNYSYGSAGGSGLSVHRMDGVSDRLRYDEYRLFTYRKLHKWDLALDLIDVKYDQKINDVTNAYSASAAVGYELTESLKVGADVEYAKNPDFDKDVRLFVKAIYAFDTAKKHPATEQEKPAPAADAPKPAAPAEAPKPAAEPAAAPAPAAPAEAPKPAAEPAAAPAPAAPAEAPKPAAEPAAAPAPAAPAEAPKPAVEPAAAPAPAADPAAPATAPAGAGGETTQKEGAQ